MIKIILGAWLLLLLGDFLSTFCYHVPEHVFGSLHVQTHHCSKQKFRHYAVLMINSQVLLDGILGALPYLLVAIALWSFSPIGVILGLLFGQFHVWWRHVSILGWSTPSWLRAVCAVIGLVTPEQHWQHHQKTNLAFGDIFAFFDAPARAWMRWLRLMRLHLRTSS
jgi:hypothetical protein